MKGVLLQVSQVAAENRTDLKIKIFAALCLNSNSKALQCFHPNNNFFTHSKAISPDKPNRFSDWKEIGG